MLRLRTILRFLTLRAVMSKMSASFFIGSPPLVKPLLVVPDRSDPSLARLILHLAPFDLAPARRCRRREYGEIAGVRPNRLMVTAL